MPITSKHLSADDADEFTDELDLPGPDAEQKARMRAGPRNGKPAKPDFKDEAFAKDVYSKFNAKPKPEDESPKREADDE
jgi:hypothetical protein